MFSHIGLVLETDRFDTPVNPVLTALHLLPRQGFLFGRPFFFFLSSLFLLPFEFFVYFFFFLLYTPFCLYLAIPLENKQTANRRMFSHQQSQC